MKSMSRGQSQQRTNSGKRTLERYKARGKANDVIVIDVDSDNFCIDSPEPLRQTPPCTWVSRNDKASLCRNIICIDDDKSSDCDSLQNGLEGSSNLASHGASCKGSQPSSNQSQSSVELDNDECLVVQEGKNSLNSSKCEVKYPGEVSSRDWHGLNSVTTNSSCEDDSSDCDLVEDNQGKICEQWQMASSKKKIFKNDPKGQPGSEDQVSASGSITDSQDNVEAGNTTDQTAEAPNPSGSSNINEDKDNSATQLTEDEIVHDASLRPEGDNHFADLKQPTKQEGPLFCRTQSCREPQFSPRNGSFQCAEEKILEYSPISNTKWKSYGHVNHDGFSFGYKCQGFDLHPTQEKGGRECNHGRPCLYDKKENILWEPSLFGNQSEHGTRVDFRKASSQDEEASTCNSQNFTQPCDETEVIQGIAYYVDNDRPIPAWTFICNTQLEGQLKIVGREILKKTDLSRHAVEEEWESRQQQLRIRAEEAQRLCKRKKAETMRLLDMERRQKQRLEEIREAQKKVHAAFKQALLRFHPD